MGFDTREEAVRVYSCLQQQLSMLQMRASSTRSDAQHLPHSHKLSYDGFSSMNGAFDDASAMKKSAAARQVVSAAAARADGSTIPYMTM